MSFYIRARPQLPRPLKPLIFPPYSSTSFSVDHWGDEGEQSLALLGQGLSLMTFLTLKIAVDFLNSEIDFLDS